MRAIAIGVLLCFTSSTAFAATPFTDWRPSQALLAELALQQQPPSTSTACDDSRAQGRKDSQANHGSMGWLIGGLGAGVGAGLIGLGVLTPIAALSNPQPEAVPPAVADQSCYRLGYASQSKSKNWKSALLGSALGTAAWFAWYAAATAE